MCKFRVGDYISTDNRKCRIIWKVNRTRMGGKIYYAECIKNTKKHPIYCVGTTWHLSVKFADEYYHKLNNAEVLATVL